jgi:hypothetical protein
MRKADLTVVGAGTKPARKRAKPKQPSLIEILHRQRKKIGCRGFTSHEAPELFDLAMDAKYLPARRRSMLWRGVWFRIEHGLTTRRVVCRQTGAVLVAVLDV